MIKYSLLFALLLSTHLFCQNPEWVVYDTSNSQLKSNNIHDIAIDRFNRKWILNDSGLVKIDGDNWGFFKTTPQNYNLRSAGIIKTDNNGNVWLGGGYGVLKFDGITWTSYNTSNSPLPDNVIYTIEFDNENNMWILCGEPEYNYPRYLVKFNRETEWTIFNGNFLPTIVGDLAAIDDQDTIWTVDLWHIYKFKDSTYTTITTPGGFGGDYISSIKFDNSHNLWVAAGHAGWGGLTRFDGTNYFFYNYAAISLDVDVNNLWVGTENLGDIDGSGNLLLYNGTNWKVFTPENSPLPKNLDIMALEHDRFGNLWIGLLPNGPSTGNRIGGGVAVYKEGGVITPVELSAFTTYVEKDNIVLNWQTATEINNKGFEIQRKSSNSDFITVAFLNGKGTSTNPNNYSWSEKVLPGTYSYRLKQLDYNGKFEYSKVVEVTVIPNVFSLEQNYPNPFNPSTAIKFSLPKAMHVSLNIYNSMGQEVSKLISKDMSTGVYTAEWNASGFASGVYYYRMVAGDFVQTKKLLVLK